MSSNMNGVLIEVSTEGCFSHKTLSLMVCVFEIIGQSQDCDAKFSYAIIDTYIYIHVQPCDKKSIRKKATERDLKSGKLCRNSVRRFQSSAQHSSLRAFPPVRQIAGRKGNGANSGAHTQSARAYIHTHTQIHTHNHTHIT
ncbi:hypothetical protein ALC62_15308 [Cyphomyrmex costatus]|uniref:Uncharacterized protein n=1 Tax=Cyphomyrmex costatus TaxID=456900 RepID=A0A151I7H7_9HYME|nr:hypothetical protein ALC62_15308 [Cyphomyrmex costatus]